MVRSLIPPCAYLTGVGLDPYGPFQLCSSIIIIIIIIIIGATDLCFFKHQLGRKPSAFSALSFRLQTAISRCADATVQASHGASHSQLISTSVEEA